MGISFNSKGVSSILAKVVLFQADDGRVHPRIMLHSFIPCYGSSILGPSKNIRFVPEFMCQALKIAKKSANEFDCAVCYDLTCIKVVI